MRFGSLRYACIGLVVLAAMLTVTAVAQGWRRPNREPVYSSRFGGDYRVCRDGIRFEAGDWEATDTTPPPQLTLPLGFKVYSPPPFDPPPNGPFNFDLGTIVAEGVVTLTRQTVPVEIDGIKYWYFGTHSQRWAGGQLLEPAPTDGVLFEDPNDSFTGFTETDPIDDCYLFPPTSRMVGKGSVSDDGLKAAYAYILPCDAAQDTDAHFEARAGGNSLRLTSVDSVVCRDDPAVPTPAAGFDTQRGTGTATLNGTPGYELKWKLVDGGEGGTNDFVRARVTGPGGAVLFRGSAAPPGKFPGSDQTTGNNTAQLLP